MNKVYILEEIKRTTKANGGVPLGVRRFESETGIKESDWLGKIWARWSDAIREAGFSPNQLSVAYDDSALLDMYARFARELGRLPTNADMRLKANIDSQFPSHNVFGRFGTKPELIRSLIEYCRGHDGYDDVIHLCEAYTPRPRKSPADGEPHEEESGFIYLLKSGRFYKIGRTNAVGRREYELAIQLPERATVIHSIRTDDPSGIEAYWHKRFEGKRKNGEWFELGAADIAAFKRRRFM